MTSDELVIVDTGMANLASISAAFRRLGKQPKIATDPTRVVAADRLVLPGVGHFGPAMVRLRATGMDQALAYRAANKRPILAICLGMQLLFEGSEESRDTIGLGIIEGRANRFDPSVASPQFGWNQVNPNPDCRLLRNGPCYFANSFKIDAAPPGWASAWSDHGGRFISAIEGRGILACQFHPELSGETGTELLSNWLCATETEASTC